MPVVSVAYRFRYYRFGSRPFDRISQVTKITSKLIFCCKYTILEIIHCLSYVGINGVLEARRVSSAG